MKTIKFTPGLFTVITNDGALDVEDFLVTGKPNEEAVIGKFGTGSKFALAHYMKKGYEVYVQVFDGFDGEKEDFYKVTCNRKGVVCLSNIGVELNTNIHKGFGSQVFNDKKAHLEIIYNAQDSESGVTFTETKHSEINEAYCEQVGYKSSTTFYIKPPSFLNSEYEFNLIGVYEGENPFDFGNILYPEDGYPVGKIFYKGVEIDGMQDSKDRRFSINITTDIAGDDFRDYDKNLVVSWFVEAQLVLGYGVDEELINLERVVSRFVHGDESDIHKKFFKELKNKMTVVYCPLSTSAEIVMDKMVAIIPEKDALKIYGASDSESHSSFLRSTPTEEDFVFWEDIIKIFNLLGREIIWVDKKSPWYGSLVTMALDDKKYAVIKTESTDNLYEFFGSTMDIVINAIQEHKGLYRSSVDVKKTMAPIISEKLLEYAKSDEEV